MKYKIGLIFIILLSLGLNLCGINWGIPTKDRIKLIFNNSLEIKRLSTALKDAFKKPIERGKGVLRFSPSDQGELPIWMLHTH
jgi:hypothetical protein